MIPEKEILTVEFKSDRGPLSDRELVETVVCLANSDGGVIYLGVEDDGRVSGVHKNHENYQGLAAMIANRTTPPVQVDVTPLIQDDQKLVLCIKVPKISQIIATTDGVIKRRRMQSDGKPECVPFLPHEFASRLANFHKMDISALPVPEATLDDLDPVQRARLRQFIERNSGDEVLLELEDSRFDSALGLTAREGDAWHPTLTGLLLIGREESLRRLLPTHEIAFQMLEGEEVRLNEFTRFLQKDPATTGRILERLVEVGLVQPHGSTRGKTYTLSPQLYKELGSAAEYTRQAGFARLQQEQLVKNFVQQHGSIRRSDVMDLCRLDGMQAYRLLRRLVDNGVLKKQGEKRWTRYIAGPNF